MTGANLLRSSFKDHVAGTGIIKDPTLDDDYIIRRGIKVPRKMLLPTDRFIGNKAAFDEYCKMQSGEVKVYKLSDLEK